MPFKLDHVIIAVHDLNTAVADFRALGFTVIYGGEHASGTTHNALICFRDGTYIELLAPTGKPAAPGTTDFSTLLHQGEGLVGYALLSDDLMATVAQMRERGIAISDPSPGKRVRQDGVELRWLTATVNGGFSPFFIQDETPRNLRVPDDEHALTHTNGAHSLITLEAITLELSFNQQEYYRKLLQTPPTYRYEAPDCFYQLDGTLSQFQVTILSDAALQESLERNDAIWREMIERGIDYDPSDHIAQRIESIHRRYQQRRQHLKETQRPLYSLTLWATVLPRLTPEAAAYPLGHLPKPQVTRTHGVTLAILFNAMDPGEVFRSKK